jgi:hypothetical protein
MGRNETGHTCKIMEARASLGTCSLGIAVLRMRMQRTAFLDRMRPLKLPPSRAEPSSLFGPQQPMRRKYLKREVTKNR